MVGSIHAHEHLRMKLALLSENRGDDAIRRDFEDARLHARFGGNPVHDARKHTDHNGAYVISFWGPREGANLHRLLEIEQLAVARPPALASRGLGHGGTNPIRHGCSYRSQFAMSRSSQRSTPTSM